MEDGREEEMMRWVGWDVREVKKGGRCRYIQAGLAGLSVSVGGGGCARLPGDGDAGWIRSVGRRVRAYGARGVEFASRLCRTQIKRRLNAPAVHCVAASAGRANACKAGGQLVGRLQAQALCTQVEAASGVPTSPSSRMGENDRGPVPLPGDQRGRRGVARGEQGVRFEI